MDRHYSNLHVSAFVSKMGAVISLITAPITAFFSVCSCASCCIGQFNLCNGVCDINDSLINGVYIAILGSFMLLGYFLRSMGDGFNIPYSSWEVHCHDPLDHASYSIDVYCKGDAAVYRLSFVQSMFFGLLSILSFASPSCHKGLWGFKFMGILVACIVVFFIPNSFFDNSGYAWVARVGSLVFIGLQMLLLIDLAYESSSFFIERAFPPEGGDHDKKYIFGMLLLSVLLYSTVFVGIPYCFSNYPDYLFTSIETLCLIILLTSCTFLRHIITGDEDLRGEILPAAIVSAYLIYLLWSSLGDSTDYDVSDNPQLESLKFFVGAIFSALSLMYTAYSTSNSYENYTEYNIVEPLVNDKGENHNDTHDIDENKKKRNAIFHIIMLTASMHMAMLITNWGVNEYNTDEHTSFKKGNIIIKNISQILIACLYIWSLFAPAILTDRDFD